MSEQINNKVNEEVEVLDAEIIETPEATDMNLIQYNAASTSLSVSGRAATLVNVIHGTDKDGKKLMSDDQLKRLFGSVVETEKAAFVLRGAAAYEIVLRVQEAGKEFNTEAGNGVDTVLRGICKEVGVERQTLQEDFRIYKQFGKQLVEDLGNSPEALLAREDYRLALQVQDTTWCTPDEMLDYFREMRQSTLAYGKDFARRDVKRVNGGMNIDEVRKADLKEREAALKEAESGKKKTVKERMMNIQVVVSDQMQYVVDKVQGKYGSMSSWILKMGKQEFGDAPLPPPKPVVKKAAPKKAAKKTTKAKAKPASKAKGKAAPKKKAAPKVTTTAAPDGDTGAA